MCIFTPIKKKQNSKNHEGSADDASGTSLSTIYLSLVSSLQDEVAALLRYLETVTERGSVTCSRPHRAWHKDALQAVAAREPARETAGAGLVYPSGCSSALASSARPHRIGYWEGGGAPGGRGRGRSEP